MNTPLIHPLDLVGATGDREAAGLRRRQPLHLNADQYDAEDGPWLQVPDPPLGAILVAASLFAVIAAMVLLL